MAYPISLKTFCIPNFIIYTEKQEKIPGSDFPWTVKIQKKCKKSLHDVAKYWILYFGRCSICSPHNHMLMTGVCSSACIPDSFLPKGEKSQLYQSMLMFLLLIKILIICLVRKLFQKVYLERCIISLRRMIKYLKFS